MSHFSEIKETAEKYLVPSYSRFDVAVEKGRGATLWDADGKEYVDFGSGIGVNSLGYADEGWVKAVSAQAARLAHISNLYYNSVQVELAKRLCTAAGFAKVFFANSGAEANEGLIKLARKYSFDKYGEGRSTVVTLENSFHGRTMTTLAATGQEQFHRYFFPFTQGFRFAKANDFEALQAACTGDVCAVLLEAVQGEGGVLPLDADYVKKAAEFAKANDILLMFDEVQTGMGRTGRFFAHEHFGVKPDAVSCAKGIAGGLPMGAVLCAPQVADVLGPGTHASTFGGNPVVCAGALEVVKRVSQPEFLRKVEEKGGALREGLGKMPRVKNLRGLGLMLAFDIEGADSKKAAVELAKRGLLVLTAKSSIRLLPPLVISPAEIEKGLGILGEYIGSLR